MFDHLDDLNLTTNVCHTLVAPKPVCPQQGHHTVGSAGVFLVFVSPLLGYDSVLRFGTLLNCQKQLPLRCSNTSSSAPTMCTTPFLAPSPSGGQGFRRFE